MSGAEADGSVRFRSTPTASDFLWNAVEAARSSVFSIAIGTFATASGLVGLAVLREPLIVLELLAGVALLSGLFVVPFVWWAIRQRRDLVLAPLEVSANPDDLLLASSTGTSRHDWSVFRNIRETRAAFVLDTGANVALLVPTRGASDAQIVALRTLAVRTGKLRTPAGLARVRRPVAGVAIGLALAAASILAPILLRPPV